MNLKETMLQALSGEGQEKIVAALIAEAGDGNLRAFEIIREILGEKGNSTRIDNSVVERVEDLVRNGDST